SGATSNSLLNAYSTSPRQTSCRADTRFPPSAACCRQLPGCTTPLSQAASRSRVRRPSTREKGVFVHAHRRDDAHVIDEAPFAAVLRGVVQPVRPEVLAIGGDVVPRALVGVALLGRDRLHEF